MVIHAIKFSKNTPKIAKSVGLIDDFLMCKYDIFSTGFNMMEPSI